MATQSTALSAEPPRHVFPAGVGREPLAGAGVPRAPPAPWGRAWGIAASPSPGAGGSHPAGMIPALPRTHAGRDSSREAAEKKLPVAGVASGLFAGSLPPPGDAAGDGEAGERCRRGPTARRAGVRVPCPILFSAAGHPSPRGEGSTAGLSRPRPPACGDVRGGSPVHLGGRFSTFPCTG